LLWSKLRNHQLLGLKFRRQYSIGPHIADFCCYERRLIIEIDGPSHDFTAEDDERRTRWLESEGFRVVRFGNDEVLNDLDGVVERLMAVLAAPSPDPPDVRGIASPRKGERG
jgi:very-short-patch-repair endonuclease